jgi:hypothetical protein
VGFPGYWTRPRRVSIWRSKLVTSTNVDGDTARLTSIVRRTLRKWSTLGVARRRRGRPGPVICAFSHSSACVRTLPSLRRRAVGRRRLGPRRPAPRRMRSDHAFLIRRTAIPIRKIPLKIHRIVQDSSDLQGVGFGDAVEKEMPRMANSIPGPSRGLAAEIEMIRSAICGDFRALTAAGAFGIIRDLLNRCRNKLCVSLQRLRAKIFFRPGKDARDVASRLRSDDDFHFLTRRSSQRSS